MAHGATQWMLHADHSFADHPLLTATGDGAVRGVGVELRLYEADAGCLRSARPSRRPRGARELPGQAARAARVRDRRPGRLHLGAEPADLRCRLDAALGVAGRPRDAGSRKSRASFEAMNDTVAIIAPGAMGSARRPPSGEPRIQVVTVLDGAERSQRRARPGGGHARRVGRATSAPRPLILSIVPPGEAKALASRMARPANAGRAKSRCSSIAMP